MKNFGLAALGGGVGLRHEHLEDVIARSPEVGWFEVIAENFCSFGGFARERLQDISKCYPIVGHGVCLSLGSTDPLDLKHLSELKSFLNEIRSPWYSDHLCFTMVDHTNLNDLIPLPFTEEAANNCIERIKIVQDKLEKPFLIENVTRYITVSDREMSELEFLCKVLDGARCGLLLDLTNLHLNGKFHGYDPYDFMSKLPLNRVGQVHLAGWEKGDDGEIIDSHDAPVPPQVWNLFAQFIKQAGPTSVLIEWDANLPSLDRLVEEARAADKLLLQEAGFSRTPNIKQYSELAA